MSELSIPAHIGYIVDGNRRWAKKHGLPSYEGHLAGYKVLKEVAIETLNSGVEYMSAYVWSTENWNRSKEEASKLMNLMVKVLTSDIPIFQENNIRLKVIGTREGLSEKVVKAIDKAEEATSQNSGGTFAVCFNYGGQMEIADSIKKIVQAGYTEDEITPELVSEYIYEPSIPTVDVIVRTGGEMRISNFMLWRSAYSELIFIKKFWPDMTNKDVKDIIKEYSKRNRRFGG
jgi:undecaprenyl diphosphate synthase